MGKYIIQAYMAVVLVAVLVTAYYAFKPVEPIRAKDVKFATYPQFECDTIVRVSNTGISGNRVDSCVVYFTAMMRKGYYLVGLSDKLSYLYFNRIKE